MQTWEKMAQFQGVDLQDSWVLSWRLYGGKLCFEIEASLWPGHPQYETPPPEDHTCYKHCDLIFPNVSRISGLHHMEEVRGTRDPDGSHDYGAIDSLISSGPGKYQIFGEFGEVSLESDEPLLDFTGSKSSGA